MFDLLWKERVEVQTCKTKILRYQPYFHIVYESSVLRTGMCQVWVCEVEEDTIQAEPIKKWAKVQYELQFLLPEPVCPTLEMLLKILGLLRFPPDIFQGGQKGSGNFSSTLACMTSFTLDIYIYKHL